MTMKEAPSGAGFWDSRYAQDGFAYGVEPNRFLRQQARELLRPGMRALVPGDGEGRNGVWLAEQGLDVTAVDMSAVGCGKARALAAARGVPLTVVQADLALWSWPVGAFDAVASIYLHLPAGIRPRLHAAMHDALRPGGVLILEAFNPGQIGEQGRNASGGPRDPSMLYSKATIRSDFPDGRFLLLEEQETDLAEGSFHLGRAAVVRAVLRRPA